MTLDESPTPRISTGAFDTARLQLVLAGQLGERLRAAAEREPAFARGLALRSLARRCSALEEGFAAWLRKEATFEQQAGDLEAFDVVRAEARQLGVG